VLRIEVYFLLNNTRGILNSFKITSIVNIDVCALIDTQCIDWQWYAWNERREMIIHLSPFFKLFTEHKSLNRKTGS
jgi:hypothetical protein